MSLRFSDALRLSWSNVTGHKGRSASVVISISLLFGLIMGFCMVLAGVEDSVLKATTAASGDEIYVRTGILPTVDDPSWWEALPKDAEKIVEQRVRNYGGEIVGEVADYDIRRVQKVNNEIFYNSIEYHVLSGKFIEGILDRSGINVPDGKIPVLLSERQSLSVEDEKEFFEVGEFMSTSVGVLTLSGDFNPINLVFSLVNDLDAASMYLLDDGSGVVQRFLDENIAEAREEYKEVLDWERGDGVYQVWDYDVARFNTAKGAARYYDDYISDGKKYGYKVETNGKYRYVIKDLFGRTIGVAAAFYSFNAYIWMFGVVLLLFAICIAALTLQRIVDGEVATVALYRSMGASTVQIYLIYFLYLLELCILAVATCLLIGLVVAGVMYLFSAESMAERLQMVYRLEEKPRVSFVGLNGMLWWIAGGILIIAPIALLMNMKRFSARYVARKLKG